MRASKDTRLIPFPTKNLPQPCPVSSSPSREELIEIVKKVLKPKELFKLQSVKRRKDKGADDLIPFVIEEVTARISSDNT